MSKVKNTFFLFFYLVSIGLVAQDTRLISGTVSDAATGEPLPFATVSLKGTALGTVSNSQGTFAFRIPSNTDIPLVTNFIGYEPFEIAVNRISVGQLEIKLSSAAIELQELVIRPLTPQEYIKLAVSKFPQNYTNQPFETRAYYREKIAENGSPLKYTEGYFKSHYPDYIQPDSTQHQLLLYNEVDDPADLAFMKKFREKKDTKKRKKAKRKGEEFEPDDPNTEIIESTFGGPASILSEDPVSSLASYLDSTQFKKYKYEYAGAANYLGRKLMIISFKSRGKMDHIKEVGKIYFDYETDAIAAIELSGKVVIPAWARPILFAFGLAIREPNMKMNVRYQLKENSWYPENFYVQANIGLTKRYMFSKNEKSEFEVENLYSIHQVMDNNRRIEKDNLFDPEKKMKEQIKPEINFSWDDVNTLVPESIEKTATQIEE